MRKATIVGAAFAALFLFALIFAFRAMDRGMPPIATTSPATSVPAPAGETTRPVAGGQDGFLYGRVTAVTGATYEGRLRFGGNQEAFWTDFFNGVKSENPWLAQVPPEKLPKTRQTIAIFGWKLGEREKEASVHRPLVTRFGEISRIESHGKLVRVTLKSGAVLDVNRFDASDFDDGLRIWDAAGGTVDLDSLQIRAIELLPTPKLGGVPERLHGTVRSQRREVTGFVEWDRGKCVGSDELSGRTAQGEELALRLDAIRSISRRSAESALVTTQDGREVLLSGTKDVGRGNRGVHVDGPDGRVAIPWDTFDRVDFSSAGSGPGYGDFPPGRPLEGSVVTRGGRRLTGRIVYDLDESDTVETLDAPADDVDYNIPFGRISSIVLPGGGAGAEPAKVVLRGGEELTLDRDGDLGGENAGLLVFVEGPRPPEYVPWTDVERVEFP